MHTIEEVITALEQGATSNIHRDAVEYLKQYRDSRNILKTENIIEYWGKLPVVKIKDHYYAVRDYIRDKRAWRCHRLKWSDISYQWSCEDDDNYIIDDNGTILYREVGWDLRKVYEDEKN